MDKDAYVFNASLFFKIGIKIYWEFRVRHIDGAHVLFES